LTGWPNTYPELTATLPAELDGVELVRTSWPGKQFEGGDICFLLLCPGEASGLASALDRSIDDVAVAIGFKHVNPSVFIVVFRVEGAANADLVAARLKAVKPMFHVVQSIAGKSVTFDETFPSDDEYLYQHAGLLFVVKAPLEHWPPDEPPAVTTDVESTIAALP
jgi:hypothetical protein